MASIVVQSGVWDPILGITLSKFCWHVWSKAGVHGIYSHYYSILWLIILWRCRAFHKNLDNEEEYQCPCTKDITEALINTYEVPILWSEHGIVSDVIVSPLATRRPLSTFLKKLALHQRLSASRYSWINCPRSPSPNHKRNFQRSSGNVGRRIFSYHPRKNKSKSYFRRHRSPVRIWSNLRFNS
jgi:hypothetical protein